MIDETFHLTPLDVRRYEFGKVLRGYDPERVDQFREQVAEELERLARLNQELDNKARGFHEQLRAFRERDKAINEALISAQQLRGEIREQAEKEAQLIKREAKAEGERMIEEARAEGEKLIEAARSEVRRIEDQLLQLERTRRAYLAQIRAFVERQLSEITAAEHTPNAPAPAPSSAPAGSNGARESAANQGVFLGSLVNE